MSFWGWGLRLGGRRGGGGPSLQEQFDEVLTAKGLFYLDARHDLFQNADGTVAADTNEDVVKYWGDQIGVEHHIEALAMPAAYSAAGLNGGPAVRLSESALQRTLSIGVTSKATITVVLVASFDDISSVAQQDLYVTTQTRQLVRIAKHPSLKRLAIGARRLGATVHPFNSVEQYAGPAGRGQVIEALYEYTDGKLTHFGDGSFMREWDGFDSAGDPNPAGATWKSAIGSLANGATPTTGYLGALLYLEGKLTANERSIVTRYFGSVWDIEHLSGPPGAWTWYNDPRVLYAGDKYIVGTISGGAMPCVTVDGTTTPLSFHGVPDDHDNPAIIRRASDGRLLAFSARHNNNFVRLSISTNPDDGTAWGAAANLASQLGESNYSYCEVVQLEGATDDPIYLMFRNSSGINGRPYMSVSTDGGTTWSTAVNQFSISGRRPYVKLVKSTPTRFDCVIANGQPTEAADVSIYHCFFEDGAWHTSDGTPIAGSLPHAITSCTLVWSGAAAGNNSWNWGITYHDGVPVIAFARFETNADHRYHQARWSGSAWTTSEVCAAGGPLYAGQPNYSGGFMTDPGNPDVIYASRDTGDGNHQIWRYTSADAGATWDAGIKLTNGAEKAFRPYVVRDGAGDGRVFYVTGIYDTFNDFRSHIKSLAIT